MRNYTYGGSVHSPTSESFVTANDVADYLQTSVSFVRKATRQALHPLPSYRVPGNGRAVRYLLSDVTRWLESQPDSLRGDSK